MGREGALPPDVLAFGRLALTPEDTARLGRVFGERSPDGAVLLLAGDLGAGKTTFAQGVAEGCGVPGPVASPTFNLVLHHEGRRSFVHADLYRLRGPEELDTLDVEEVLAPSGVACVEWPDLLVGRVSPPFAAISLAREGGGRRIAARLVGGGWSPLVEALDDGR